MSLTTREEFALERLLGGDLPTSAALFTLRAHIAAQLFVGSVRNETGAAEAVAEADMLLKELLK